MPKIVLMLTFINMEEVSAETELRIIIQCNAVLLVSNIDFFFFYTMFLYNSVFKTVLERF